jgi:hypothetical protein
MPGARSGNKYEGGEEDDLVTESGAREAPGRCFE